jgi:subtilisin family serine protease
VNAFYTQSFNGTSSASPVVAASAAAVSSAYQTLNGKAPTPQQVRSWLIQTGTPQNTATGFGHIGPLPNLAKALLKTDLTAPAAPTNLAVTKNHNKNVTLAWTASTDNVKVAGYHVYRSGWFVYATVPAPMTTFTDISVTVHHTYTYVVKAVDSADHESVGSSITVTVK